ncbi:MAG: nucleotidyl transferase AbiEii/AbiGii toxin family protein [Ancrocorticia sp.]|uniref:nucleotidyl transferase AbiEii/AbiGii toxin family protein n=1 Tax=Ancrocorticia sp. TaxID=2593684 RepID=UPI003F921344
MDSVALQRHVARVALQVLKSDGFVLAGSGAIREHGLINRPTEDIDLFTSRQHSGEFQSALKRLVSKLVEQGVDVSISRQSDEYARLTLRSPNQEDLSIDLGVDWRGSEPAELDIGPVLSLLDSVGSKVAALYSRNEARDFLDVDTIRETGAFSDTELIDMAKRFEPNFDLEYFTHVLQRSANIIPEQVQPYGITPTQLVAIQDRLMMWARSVSDDKPQSRE